MANFFKKYLLPAAAGAVTGGVMNRFTPTKGLAAAGSTLAGALASKNKAAGAALGFAGGGVGGSLASGITGNGAMNGFNSYVGSIPGFGGYGTNNPTGMMSKMFNSSIKPTTVTSNTNPSRMLEGFNSNQQSRLQGLTNADSISGANMLNNFGSTQRQSLPAQAPSAPTPSNSAVMDMLKKTAITAAPSILSGFMAPKVDAPDFSSVTDPLRERIMNPSQDYLDALSAYKSELNPAVMDAEPALAQFKLKHDRELADAERSLAQQFAAANPGAGIQGNSAYQSALNDLRSRYNQNYMAQVAQTQFNYDTIQKQNKLAAANAIAGMDQAQIQALAELAQYDIYTISMKTGMDIDKAKQVQELGSNISALLAEQMMNS